MHYSFHALTDTGLVRTNNEDSLTFDQANGIAVLADGMGGYNAGEVASGMATAFVKSELARWCAAQTQQVGIEHIAQAMERCVNQVNVEILNAAVSNQQYAGMGTTLVVAVFRAAHLVLGHIGDSRCYRWRKGQLAQLTKDHSMLQEQVDAGLLTSEQAAVAPGRNLLTRALGVEDVVQIDIQADLVEDGDLYLLCSDGLTDMLSDAEMAQILSSGASMPQTAQGLVARANACGGRDNIAVLLVQAAVAPERPGLMSRWFGKRKAPEGSHGAQA
ncbi:Stp1/IreP family PP2C-type Ser/Thr phosphatase [Rhodoferax sp.]|uniref:Stp1/IreP family PP2C-type Ser/Thr phosphatase n=1 Tax=Rhodoferax sp. TaxID=50421 RepID=UPI00262F1EB4|nr:Stp1/IreP family PP2C-type Ser/Thr phosphatase [Rhodoferax sp.]MDD2925625.1 Stp1/IreP family PP2C-type Ser/Thr phosphatase [Rhodoferax sp.]